MHKRSTQLSPDSVCTSLVHTMLDFLFSYIGEMMRMKTVALFYILTFKKYYYFLDKCCSYIYCSQQGLQILLFCRSLKKIVKINAYVFTSLFSTRQNSFLSEGLLPALFTVALDSVHWLSIHTSLNISAFEFMYYI